MIQPHVNGTSSQSSVANGYSIVPTFQKRKHQKCLAHVEDQNLTHLRPLLQISQGKKNSTAKEKLNWTIYSCGEMLCEM